MKVYYKLDSLSRAVEYAHYVLANSSTSAYGIPAYYVLMEQAEKENDTQKLGEYAGARADLQWKEVQHTEQKVLVSQILNGYVHPADRDAREWWLIMVLICIGGCMLYIVITFKKREEVSAISIQEGHLERQQKESTYTAEQVEDMIENFSNYVGNKTEIWSSDCYADFCKFVDLYLCNMADKLHRIYHLSPQDTRICVLTLMKQSRKEMAEKLYRSESSIPKLRSRMAKQMGTDSVHLRDFLIDFIAK